MSSHSDMLTLRARGPEPLDLREALLVRRALGRDGVVDLVQFAAGAFAQVTVSGQVPYDNPDALITLHSKLKPAYRQNTRWLMNRASEAKVRKLKDRDGRYLVGFGDIRDGVIGFNLFGYQIATGEDMPDFANNAFPIAFGDFREGYMIVDRLGMRIATRSRSKDS